MKIDGSVLKSMAMAFTGFSLWTVGDAMIHHLDHYPPVLLAFLVMCMSSAILLVLSPRIGGLRNTMTSPKIGLQVARGALLAVSVFFAFFTFANLELAKAYAIIFTAPLLAKILSVFLLKERIRFRSWAITTLGFTGVLIVVRPGFVPIDLGSVYALLLALTFAGGYVMTRYIGSENQTILSLALFKSLFVVTGAAVPAFYFYVPIAPFDWVFIIFMGFEVAMGTILVSRAYSSAPSAYIAPIHYVQILWGALWGALFFGEYPDIWTIVGGGVIIFAGLLLIRYTRSV